MLPCGCWPKNATKRNPQVSSCQDEEMMNNLFTLLSSNYSKRKHSFYLIFVYIFSPHPCAPFFSPTKNYIYRIRNRIPKLIYSIGAKIIRKLVFEMVFEFMFLVFVLFLMLFVVLDFLFLGFPTRATSCEGKLKNQQAQKAPKTIRKPKT